MDITMCRGEAENGDICQVRDLCYRHTAEPNPYWQSYFIGVPQDFTQKKGCGMMARNDQRRTATV